MRKVNPVCGSKTSIYRLVPRATKAHGRIPYKNAARQLWLLNHLPTRAKQHHLPWTSSACAPSALATGTAVQSRLILHPNTWLSVRRDVSLCPHRCDHLEDDLKTEMAYEELK